MTEKEVGHFFCRAMVNLITNTMTDTSCYRVVSTGKNVQHLGENECKHYAGLKGKSVSLGSFPSTHRAASSSPVVKYGTTAAPPHMIVEREPTLAFGGPRHAGKKERRFEVLKADCGSAVDFVKTKVINGGLPATSHYGSVAYQIANEDFIPFGCQIHRPERKKLQPRDLQLEHRRPRQPAWRLRDHEW